uniref:Uncharacterized protein n=1 Tax=Haptolina brevifila TaxID=156173 RepID=A0A7S2GAC2_9EUKA|mmetsp:Transcript_31033/g.62165  ORF Transcript_31033/g.62165 Transcript_31033/m.62165 type:complete len:107 (+) Transcript_31033:188-508(+)
MTHPLANESATISTAAFSTTRLFAAIPPSQHSQSSLPPPRLSSISLSLAAMVLTDARVHTCKWAPLADACCSKRSSFLDDSPIRRRLPIRSNRRLEHFIHIAYAYA